MAWLVSEALFLREVRPILATARRVSAGDLDARTGLAEGRGEIRELGRAIDDAVAALQTSHAIWWPRASRRWRRTGRRARSSR